MIRTRSLEHYSLRKREQIKQKAILIIMNDLLILHQLLLDFVVLSQMMSQQSTIKSKSKIHWQTSGRRHPSDEVWGSTGAGTSGPAAWCLPCPLLSAGIVPRRTTGLMVMWLLRRWCWLCLSSGPASCHPARQTRRSMPTTSFLWNERDGQRMAIIQMKLRIGQQNLICIAQVKENQRVIRAFLECVTLDQNKPRRYTYGRPQ